MTHHEPVTIRETIHHGAYQSRTDHVAGDLSDDALAAVVTASPYAYRRPSAETLADMRATLADGGVFAGIGWSRWEVVGADDAPDDGTVPHVDYPHEPGYLFDCPACEARCHCTPGASECVWHGHDADMVEVCTCCLLVVANGDDSGCRDYYGHTHPACSLPVTAAPGGDDGETYWHRWTCAGCGTVQEPGATAHRVMVRP